MKRVGSNVAASQSLESGSYLYTAAVPHINPVYDLDPIDKPVLCDVPEGNELRFWAFRFRIPRANLILCLSEVHDVTGKVSAGVHNFSHRLTILVTLTGFGRLLLSEWRYQ